MGLITNFYNDGYLIIDTSYLTHTIASRSIKIYSEHYDDLPTDDEELYKIDFSKDNDFMSIFNRNFKSTINKFLSQFRLPKQHTIFAFDCKKSDIWRRSFYMGYKLGRIKSSKDQLGFNKGPLFGYVKDELVPSLIESEYGFILNNPVAEGDDIIAITTNYIKRVLPEVQIIIMTCDGDFLQLASDNVEIYNIQNKNIKEKSIGTPSQDLLKILIGDGADEIPKCFNKQKGDKEFAKGFGEKAALKLVQDPNLLKEKFNLYPEAVKQYQLNYKLVCFDAIPKIITEDIENKIQEHIKL